MNKKMSPLEILEKIKFTIVWEYGEYRTLSSMYKKELKIIEKALKRLEQIDNSVKFDMEYYEKRNRALEIIKEKKVNVGLLLRCATVERYNKGICYEPRHLTQEEYDSLKEVLL